MKRDISSKTGMMPQNIWKTWKGHAGFGCLAFDALPAWQKELFKPDITHAEFRMETDLKLNKVYSEDLKYGGRILTRVPLHPGQVPGNSETSTSRAFRRWL